MGMYLKHNCTGTNDCSSLPSGVGRRADKLRLTMRSRQRIRLRQRAPASSLSGSTHTNHQPPFSHLIEQATRGGKRLAGEQIFLKEHAKRLHGVLIKGGKKPRQRRAMGQVVAAKEGHIWSSERSELLVNGQQGGFPRKNRADQDRDEIFTTGFTKKLEDPVLWVHHTAREPEYSHAKILLDFLQRRSQRGS